MCMRRLLSSNVRDRVLGRLFIYIDAADRSISDGRMAQEKRLQLSRSYLVTA